MKKKFVIINVLLSMAVLFSILFQAIHSYEHYSELLTEKKCHHDHSKNEITHSHTISEKCMICDFNFSSYTTPDFFSFEFHKTTTVTHTALVSFQKNAIFFKGSLFALRAPPLF